MSEVTFHCDNCNYSTVSRVNLYKHKVCHRDEKTHKCSQCDYTCRTASNLKRHEATHQQVKRFQCGSCHKLFAQKAHLITHLRRRHTVKKHVCGTCYGEFHSKHELQKHMKTAHESRLGDVCHVLPTASGLGVKSQSVYCCETDVFQCGLCGQSFKNGSILRQHQKVHSRGPELKFFCKECPFVTHSSSKLSRHRLTHSQAKPFQCGFCEYRSNQKEHVTRHIRAKHKDKIQSDDSNPPDPELNSTESGSKAKNTRLQLTSAKLQNSTASQEETEELLKNILNGTDETADLCGSSNIVITEAFDEQSVLYIDESQIIPNLEGTCQSVDVTCDFQKSSMVVMNADFASPSFETFNNEVEITTDPCMPLGKNDTVAMEAVIRNVDKPELNSVEYSNFRGSMDTKSTSESCPPDVQLPNSKLENCIANENRESETTDNFLLQIDIKKNKTHFGSENKDENYNMDETKASSTARKPSLNHISTETKFGMLSNCDTFSEMKSDSKESDGYVNYRHSGHVKIPLSIEDATTNSIQQNNCLESTVCVGAASSLNYITPYKSELRTQLENAASNTVIPKYFGCNFCTMTFSKLLNLYKHIHAMHPSKVQGRNAELKCVICSYIAPSKNTLQSHMRYHTQYEQTHKNN